MQFTRKALYTWLGTGSASVVALLTAAALDGKLTGLEFAAAAVCFVMAGLAAFTHPSTPT